MIERVHTRSTSGFTLVELVVAMLITAVLLAVAFPLVRNLLDASNRGVASGESRGGAILVQQQLTSDLRSMLADRATGDRDDPSIQNVASELSSAAVDVHDITFAGPRYLQFWADVIGDGSATDPSPGPERVTWMLLEDDASCNSIRPNWCVIRDVDWGPGHAKLLREVVTASTGSSLPLDNSCWPGKATADARLFCYQYDGPSNAAYSWTGWSSSCASSWSEPTSGQRWNTLGAGSPPPGRPGLSLSSTLLRGWSWNAGVIPTFHENPGSGVPAGRIYSLDRIRTVGFVALGGASVGGHGDADSRVAAISLRGRSGDEYTSAIECGQR